jgi:hypothetical protein
MMPLKDPEARREYHRQYMATYFKNPKNYKKHRAVVLRTKERLRVAAQALVTEFKKNGCALCPEQEPVCLSAHHYQGKKLFSVGDARHAGTLRKVAAELKKCVCLCENCHRKVHAGIKNLSRA